MAMRITDSMISRSVLSDLNQVDFMLSRTQRKLSSGKEITRPSDDPFLAGRAITLRSSIEETRQYQRNTGEANAWASVTEVALSRITESVHRARELVVKAASDSSGPTARAAIAVEMENLIESIKQEANASYSGRYVFSGTASNVKPYGTADAYAGDTGMVAREVGPGVALNVNVLGSEVLGSGQAAGDDKLLDVMRDVVDHLRGGTPADAEALRGTDLARFSANLDALTGVRARVGAIVNRLETAEGRLMELEEAGVKLLSDVEDADMARTLVDYTMQQSVYQSALKAGANIVQASLLDFLR